MISTATLTVLIAALSMVESRGNPRAYNPEEHAVGHLQIRQCVIDDVNRLKLLPYKVKLIDAYNPETAEKICRVYLGYWVYLTGQSSLEDGARIWNGGPDGWWKLSTLPYWYKVQKELFEQELQNDVRKALLDMSGTISAQTNKVAVHYQWQPPQISPSPAVPSASIPGTTAKSSSRSDLAITFIFDSNASEGKVNLSICFPSTTKPSVSLPAPAQASQPPTLVPVRILGDGVRFEFNWNDTR